MVQFFEQTLTEISQLGGNMTILNVFVILYFIEKLCVRNIDSHLYNVCL